MATFHKLVLIVGFVSIFHSAYSAAQHRSYLRLNELDFKQLPLDIIIQTIASFFVIMYGVLNVAGDFKEIKASADLDNKSWDTFRNIPSFYTFSHRGSFVTTEDKINNGSSEICRNSHQFAAYS